jgi:DNA-directed RNA polymerase specialized sigma24 family protein
LRFEELQSLEQRVANRDERAFEDLERAYTHLVQHFIFTKVENPVRARRLTEHVFEHAWKAIENYRWQDFSFHVWILRIAREEIGEEPGGGTAP